MNQELTRTESATANTILDWFRNKSILISHMKLQKIFYFSFGYYLAKNDDPMIEHQFQAWPYGPVLPGLYDKLKNYGDSSIIRLVNDESDNTPYLYREGAIFDSVTTTVNSFFGHTAWELSEITHDSNGPWFKTIIDHNREYKHEIDNEIIKNYFKKNMDRLFK